MSWWTVPLLERARGNRLGSRRWARLVLRRQGRRRCDRALRRVRRDRHRRPDRARDHRAASRAAPGGADVKTGRLPAGAVRAARRPGDRRRAGARVRPCRRDRLREQGIDERARQPCRSNVQCVRTPLRETHALLRRHASEPAELPRARVRLDAGRHDHLHKLHLRRQEPGGHDRGIGPDVEDLRGGTAGARVPRRLQAAATQRSTIPSRTFASIAEDPARRARLVPLSQLGPDVRAGALPSFSLVVPDLCHSMHDCSVAVGDAWLRSQVGKFLKLPNTVVFVMFDEGSTSIRGGGHTAALALGGPSAPGPGSPA